MNIYPTAINHLQFNCQLCSCSGLVFFFKQTILYCSHNLQFIVQCKISKLTYFIIAHEFTQKSNINAPPLSLFSSFDAFQKCLFISEKKSDFNQVEIFGSQIDAMSVDEGSPSTEWFIEMYGYRKLLSPSADFSGLILIS